MSWILRAISQPFVLISLGSGCSDGVQSLVHGDERCSENRSDNNNQLYAWLHAVKCKDERGVLESIEQEVTTRRISRCRTIYGFLLAYLGVGGVHPLHCSQVLAAGI